MSKIINCSFVMDISEFDSIDFYFGEDINAIETDYDITKHFPTTGELTHGDIKLILSDEEYTDLPDNFFIEAKLNMTNEEGSIKAFTRKIKKEQSLLNANLITSSDSETTITFYLGENSILKYDYDESFNKPSINNNILQGEKSSLDIGIEEGNWYYVDEYKINDTYPVKNNKVFAGWFTDETLTTAYTASTGMAYAYFISKDVLRIKSQMGDSAIRFIFTATQPMIKSCNSMGFFINGVYGSNVIEDKERSITKLYEHIIVDGESISPQDVGYPAESKYFATYTLTGIEFSEQPIVLSGHPFLLTEDGTKIEIKDIFSAFIIDENGIHSLLPQTLEKYLISLYPPASNESTNE